MDLIHAKLIPALWLAWCVYWIIAARSVKADSRRESVLARAVHLVPLLIAAWLIAASTLPGGFLCERLWPATRQIYFGGALIVALGLGVACWARVHIGRNWSGIVTVKQDHELVRSGPYRWVRHPIYSGLLLAFVGSAIARGEWRGVLAVVIVFLAFWIKLRLEERWMTETFGVQYTRYRAEVAALIPFVF